MQISNSVSLLHRNTFGIDVIADRLIELSPDDALPPLDSDCLILGSGSDIVFTSPYHGTILTLSNQPIVHLDGNNLKVWGGMLLDDLVLWACNHGLYGLENLSAIPGTVGAAVVQNVGAYGVEIKDVVKQVEAVDLDSGHSYTYTNLDCNFAYRSSRFKQQPHRQLIRWVEFSLQPTFVANLSYKALEGLPNTDVFQLRNAIIALRWAKLPRPEEYGSAGSFFKNPIVSTSDADRLQALYPDMPRYAGNKLSAAWLIDRAGWKGRSVGHVGVWPHQALVLYNLGGCTGNEVVHLAGLIVNDVYNQFGVRLEPEAIII